MDSFQIVDEIASGVYGTVFRAKRCSDGEAVALKRMDITCENGGLPYYLIREWAIMKVLRNHPRIAGFRSMILPDEANPKFCMEMELCVMNLYDYARQYEPRISTRRRYLKEMLEALAFIHSQGVLHRDIKPENILLTHNRQIKLADFGLSRFYHVPLRQYTMNVASRWWRAPELMLGEFKYGPAIDVWSMALIFVEVVTGRSPWRGKNNVDQLFHIFRDLGVPKHKGALSGLDRSAFPDWHGRPISRLVPGLSPVGCHLLSQMLEIDPHQRILAADALKHPFFWESVPSVTPRKNRKRARSCSPPPYRPYTRIRHCTRQQQSCTQFTRPRCDGGAPEQTNSSFLPFPRQTEAETIVQQRLLSQDLLTPMRFRTTNVHGPVHYFEKGRSVFDALLYLQKHLEMSMETVHLAFSLVSTMEARGRLGDDWRACCIGCSMIAFKLISRTIPSTEQMAEVYHVPPVCVQQAEYDCVEALDGDFYPSTVLDFIWYYFGSIPYSIKSRERKWSLFLADALLEYVQEEKDRSYPASMLGATAIRVYLRRGNFKRGWKGLFDRASRYEESEVSELAEKVNAYITCMYNMK